jgi:enoyl-CoA hydratase/carnithine racemase
MQTILVEQDRELPGLTTVTLNRPDKLNAISFQMHQELQQACQELKEDTAARVVIFTGAGRAFSAGADLRDRFDVVDSEMGPLELRHRAATGVRTCHAIESLDQVTIAAVNGLTIGGAVVFLLCMDLRLAAETAWFSIPEIDLRIPLTWNALPRLIRELGAARAKELVMTCDRFSSRDAERWGFLNRVIADDQLHSAARELAANLLSKDPLSLALTKSTARALAAMSLPIESTHSDADYLVLAMLSAARNKSA